MKKLYLILLILAFAASAFAQTVVIGNPASALGTTLTGPGYIQTSTTYHQANATILTAAEIQANNGGNHFNNEIDRLDWDIYSGSGYTGNCALEIWLATTTRANLATAENWGTYLTGATLVYSSTTQQYNATTGYQSFVFNQTNFPYNTESGENLLVLTRFLRTSAGPATLNWRYTSTSPTNMTRYYTSTTSAVLATTAMFTTTSRANIRIHGPLPYDVEVTPITANQSISAGANAWYQISVANAGLQTDSYSLSLSGNAWTTGIYDAINGSAISSADDLVSGQIFNAYVKVTSPGDALVGNSDAFVITATSANDPGIFRTATRTTSVALFYDYIYTTQQVPAPIAYQWDDPVANGHTEISYTLLSGTTDDGLFTFTMPEAFPFCNYTVPNGATVGIGTNGNIVFASTLNPMTYSTVLRGINVWGRDMGGTAARPVGAQIFTKYDAVNHTTTFTWYNWMNYNWSAGTNYQFQCVLNHTTGGVTFRYNLFPTGYATLSNYISGPRVGFVNHATSTGQTYLNLVTNSTATINALYGGGTVAANTEIQVLTTPPDPYGYAPANGAVNLDPGSTTFSWNAPGQTTFDVYYGTSNPPSVGALAQVGSSYVPTLAPGMTYYWYTVHHYASRSDFTSDVMMFTTVAPDAPNGPNTGSTANLGTTFFDVGWVDNSTNEDFFNVYVAEGAFGGGFDPTVAPYAAQTASTTIPGTGDAYNVTITGLTPNTTYAVRVYAINDNTIMKNGGKGNTGIIRSEWIETSEAVPVYETSITTGKDGKKIIEQVPVAMKAAKGYWRNLTEDNNGKTMGVDELFYSSGFATAANMTLASVPGTPVVGTPGVTSISVTPANHPTNPNPAATTYAIHCVTTGTWVQATGTLGSSPIWQTLATWGTAVVNSLTANTAYEFAVVARNANLVETVFSASASGTTLNNVALPVTQNFEGASWPPADWSIVNPDANKTWVSHTYLANKSARINFWSYNSYPQSDYLISPPMDFSNVATGEVTFEWSYLYNSSYRDSLRVWVSPDNGVTWSEIFYEGYAGLASRTTDNNNPTGWRDTTLLLPASTSGQSQVLVKFEGINRYGPDIFLDNIVIDARTQSEVVGNNPNGEGSPAPYVFTPPADPETGGLPPVVVNFPAQGGANTNPGTVTVTVMYELPASYPADLPIDNTIRRFWDIQASTENFEDASLRLRFTIDDLPAGITDPMTAVPPIEAAYSNDGGTTWTKVAGTIFDLGGGVYEMLIRNLNHFSLWSLGNGGILPVELSAFTASPADQQVILNWRTETETNNDFFRVYRSLNAADRGELVGVVEGMGNNQTTHSYRYVDTRVQNGVTYYYRIADVDLNGIEALHPIVVNATPAAGARGVVPTEYALEQNMPNPFNPTTEIRYAVKEAGLVTLKVFDITGREVATLVNGNYPANSYRISFDATKLSAGVYFYQIRVNDFYAVRKMVVAK
ncbi:MAG: T9SS type A sorting domain-containing protein [bacterium]|nr:T9SS type A sorting domain-containing protein [bacterium]